MTVAELMDLLKKCHPKSQIYIQSQSGELQEAADFYTQPANFRFPEVIISSKR